MVCQYANMTDCRAPPQQTDNGETKPCERIPRQAWFQKRLLRIIVSVIDCDRRSGSILRHDRSGMSGPVRYIRVVNPIVRVLGAVDAISVIDGWVSRRTRPCTFDSN